MVTAMELFYRDHDYHCVQNVISAGRVLPNHAVYIVDENMNIVPPGVQREFFLPGAGVAVGYVSNPNLTAEKFFEDVFVTNDFKSRGWTTMHRVGDLGRWKEDGTLLIEGRISGDTQIKLRGIRLDLNEVESALVANSDGIISEAVVSVRRSSPETPEYFVAHVLLAPGHSAEESKNFLGTLSTSLPLASYICPAGIHLLPELLKTSSAKLDRKAIAALFIPEISTEHREDRETGQTETRLAQIWMEIIERQGGSQHQITPQTDFFHARGTSLLLLALQA